MDKKIKSFFLNLTIPSSSHIHVHHLFLSAYVNIKII